MTLARNYRASDLDGTESGGYVIMNVAAGKRNPHQILEDDDENTYFSTLPEAREVCRRLRRQSRNDMIFIYALVAVGSLARATQE